MKAVAVVRLDRSPSPTERDELHAALMRTLPRVAVLDDVAFACDLRGTERLMGVPATIGRRLLALCREHGLGAAVGIASGPFIARTLAERSPSGSVHELRPADERAYLAPLPLNALPLDPVLRDELALLGIREVGAFAALDRGAVLDRFGRSAAVAHALACGEDGKEVHGQPPPRRIVARRAWDDPIDSRERLVFALRAACDEVAAGLAPHGLAALRLDLRLERETSAPRTGRSAASALPGPLRLERLVLPPTAEPAALLRSLRWGLEELSGGDIEIGLVVGARLEATEVEPLRGRQLGLFAADGAHVEEALAVARHLRGRLGPGAVVRAEVVDPEARLPERAAAWKEVVG